MWEEEPRRKALESRHMHKKISVYVSLSIMFELPCPGFSCTVNSDVLWIEDV